MQDILQKLYIVFLSAMMGTGMIAPAPISYEGDTLDTDEQASELTEETSEEELPVWPTTISGEIYDVIKDINFDSCRIITAIDESYIFDKSVILSEYEGVYLLQFEDKDTTMAAYAYLMQYADFIDVDTAVEIAEEDESSEDTPITTDTVMSEEENPFKELSDSLKEQPDIDSDDKVIALIDSGVGHHETETDEEGEEHDVLIQDEHVINSVSVIGEDTADDNGHGDRMLAYILEEAPDAQIMSIKAIGEDGKGDISAVYAAMMYAIENDADIINLSLSAPATAENAVLKDAVEKAKDAGITVVASAGNNNKDARFYTPGNLDDVYTIGSAGEHGEKLEQSNYGDCVDFAVISKTTSEASARFSGILYASSIEAIESEINTKNIFAPDFSKAANDATEIVENNNNDTDSETIDGEFEVADDVHGAVSIDSLKSSFDKGATITEYQGDEILLWDASTNNISTHGFIFNFSFSISVNRLIDANDLEIRVPAHILKDRYGNYADTVSIDFPREDRVSANDRTTEFVYKIDGNDIVIYNRLPLRYAPTGFVTIGYYTSKTVCNYTDMGMSEPFVVNLNVTGLDGERLTKSTSPINVWIGNTAKLTSTEKKYPSKYDSWNDSWGTAPDDADSYYYFLWPITSRIEMTQPYDFVLNDNLGGVTGWISDDNDNRTYVEIPSSAHKLVGYRMSGQSTAYSASANTATSQTLDGKRYDYVLTKVEKSILSPLSGYTVTNNITATLTPIDGIDAPTTKTSMATYKWEQPTPPVFDRPTGHFMSWKHADRDSYSYNYKYLGMKYGDYTSYDLDKLKEGEVSFLENLDYALRIEGYPLPWTLAEGADWQDTASYGAVPVKYTLKDNTFFIRQDGGTSYGAQQLTADDYQIDHLSLAIRGNSLVFNELSQRFYGGNLEWGEDDVLYVYAEKNSEFVLAAEYDLNTDAINIIDNSIINSVENLSQSAQVREKRIYFADNITGFKLETTNAYYYTVIDAVPNLRLKGSEYVLSTISDWDSVAIQNTADYLITQTKNAETSVLYTGTEKANDYIRTILRSSYISKSLAGVQNIEKDETYYVTWTAKAYEQYRYGDGGKTETAYVPQESGTYYDLLPQGFNVQESTVKVSAPNHTEPLDYTVETIENFRDSGRTMLIVHINEEADYYTISLGTWIDYDSIAALGGINGFRAYNPIAYETGNASIKNGRLDDGGNLRASDKELMSNLSNDPEKKPKFLYDYAQWSRGTSAGVKTVIAGMFKRIKASLDTTYCYDTETTGGSVYSYQLRYQNTPATYSKNLILFDSLENYGTVGLVGDDVVDHEPDWKGTLEKINVSGMKLMGVAPVVYVSEVPLLDLDVDAGTHDLTDTAIWTKQEDYLLTHSDLSGVKAVAIDASKKPDGTDFILSSSEAISATLFMRAPIDAIDDYDLGRKPETFNNLYMNCTTIDAEDPDIIEDFYIHFDYTSIQLAVQGDVNLHKVSSKDANYNVPNIKFRLYGTSAYGSDIDVIKTTDKYGNITFKNIEKGRYILQEYETTRDWLEDYTEHIVEINGNGRTIIDGVDYTEDPIVIANEPRIYTDIDILKKEKNTEIEFMGDEWDPETMVKYAVALYGIGQDKDENGNAMGLTFGPATGADYVNSYKSHAPSGTTQAGNAHHCIHDDSWDKICYWNFMDPYVYEQCIKECCTHSVNLTLPETIRSATFHPNYTGDGPSRLLNEFAGLSIDTEATWNATNSNTGGWGASRIRALLNGADELTDVNPATGATLNVAGNAASRYTGGNTLFDAFPTILQESIGSKAVKYDSVYNAKTEANLKMSYDKLWLLSSNEMGDTTSIINDSDYYHPLEALDDGIYQRFAENNQKIAVVYPHTLFCSYGVSKSGVSTAGYWYLRSVGGDRSVASYLTALAVNGTGLLHYSFPKDAIGVSPCFSLTRDASAVAQAASSSESKPAWIDSVIGYQATNSHHCLNGLIPNTKFLLKGTSDYGTDVSMLGVSDNNGVMHFVDIEKGVYTLTEIEENPDFIKDETIWHITIDENGVVSSDIDAQVGIYLAIDNTPRYWSFPIHKVDAEDNNIWLQGATVRLSGVSDFGNEYNQTVTSDESGVIQFTELEKGTYVLEELSPPTGVDAEGHTGTGGNRNYIADPVKHIVTINEDGLVTISGLNIGSTGEFFLENERALDGKITVLKHWEYIEGEELPVPNLTLVNYEPGTEPALAITYDANGGYFDNEQTINMVYVKQEGQLSVIKSGQIKTPLIDDENLVFVGWYTDPACTNRFLANNMITQNMTVYAKWRDTRMRYAVSIYGIGQDVDINGDTMGLTFGPATGADYLNSFKRHDATGTTTAGYEHRCVHDDTWDEIIYWNNVDPEVYEQCVGECCTKSVPLNIPTAIKTQYDTYIYYTGDGPSALLDELQNNARIWNATGVAYGGTGTTTYNNTNGWGGSNIRAVLNGVDDDNSDGITTNAGVYARANSITTDISLIAAFPQNLQDAIGYKAVKYDSVYNAITDANLKTSYDKLWMLSAAEMGTVTNYGNHTREALNSGIYQRFTENNVTLTTSAQDFFVTYRADIRSSSEIQSGIAAALTTRSVSSSRYDQILVVDYAGCLASSYTIWSSLVSPCFALSRTPSN